MKGDSKSYNINDQLDLSSAWSDFAQLIKMRLTSLVVFTAVVSYAIAGGLSVSLWSLVLLAVGGFGVAGASNALNQVLEKDFDKMMARTENRPLPAERMTVSTAVMLSGFLCLIGITALSSFNVMAALFGMIAFILYAFVYTPLKRFTRAAVFVGAISGALPMMIGVVAYTGELTELAIALFLVQFAWQFPHFWSIAFLGFEDYKKAGYDFIPTNEVGEMDHSVSVSSFVYATCLVVLSAIMVYLNIIGLIAGLSMALVSLVYLWCSIVFWRNYDTKSAKHLMFTSLIYIPLVLFLLSIDKMF